MSPVEPEDLAEDYLQARGRARRRPTVLLRRREARIVRHRPRPTPAELTELVAIRRELGVRALHPAPRRWWSGRA